MNTQISTILVEANGYKGGFNLTITHLPEDSTDGEHVEETSWHNMLQGVEEALRNFRIKHQM